MSTTRLLLISSLSVVTAWELSSLKAAGGQTRKLGLSNPDVDDEDMLFGSGATAAINELEAELYEDWVTTDSRRFLQASYAGSAWVAPEATPEVVEPEPEPEPELPTRIGGATDDYGCLTSAGYAWCASKSSCIRFFEEDCEAAAPEVPEVVPKAPVAPKAPEAFAAGSGSFGGDDWGSMGGMGSGSFDGAAGDMGGDFLGGSAIADNMYGSGVDMYGSSGAGMYGSSGAGEWTMGGMAGSGTGGTGGSGMAALASSWGEWGEWEAEEQEQAEEVDVLPAAEDPESGFVEGSTDGAATDGDEPAV